MGEEPDDFIGYTETPLERLQFLAQYDPVARAIIEGHLSEHPGMTAKEAARSHGSRCRHGVVAVLKTGPLLIGSRAGRHRPIP